MAMDGADRGDDRTFRANFTGDGVAKLRDRVTDKLKEFMGDYTDDTLVEYVIVLLKNGRSKGEAKSELNVFLGGDTDSFISWLWDHLGSNLDLYIQPHEPHADGVAKIKPKFGEQAEGNDSHHLDSESEKDKPNKLSKSRHNREWKGLVRDADEPPPLRSSMTNNTHTEERTHHKVDRAKRSSFPQSAVQEKRSRPDEREKTKREVVSQATVNAPRRLLQFAVRDAVGTSRPSSLSIEPSLKRLRSVVSTSTGDSSLEEHSQRIRSVARVPNAMATAIKAVEEAAKDVTKVRSSRNVFDRLGRGTDVSDTTNEVAKFRKAAVEDGEYGDFNQIQQETHSSYFQRSDYRGQYVGNMTVSERDTDMSFDFASDNDGYDDVNAMGHGDVDVSHTGTTAGKEGDGSLTVQYSIAKNANEVMRRPWKDQDQLAAIPNTSSKMVNISVNVDTWNPPKYQEPREILEMDGRKSVQENEADAGKSGVQLMEENNSPVIVGNGNAKHAVDAQDSQKTLPSSSGSYATGRRPTENADSRTIFPTENADSRTIFVNNVHFAATKDSLSRHFNKFGEVIKVVILTDAATGQPKGSAYVEFMRKEAAEHALSLDGTSFLSRILKVVKKSSAPQEAAATTTWPHIARGSPFAATRYARVPFARGIPSLYRPRIPIKPGARSLQWKRDAPPSSNSIPSPTTRSLTYVRTEPKTNGNSGTA